jgi:hypothetical protein
MDKVRGSHNYFCLANSFSTNIISLFDYRPYFHLFASLFLPLQRRRYAAIEFENKLLLERLASIVQHKTIDNEIDKSTQMHVVFKRS